MSIKSKLSLSSVISVSLFPFLLFIKLFLWNEFIPENLERKTKMSAVINQDISIGANLKALRLRNKLSQEDVAAKLQVMGFTISREIISQMELGHHNIRVSVLLALKELYHATFDEIFADLSFRINDSGCGLLTKPAGRSKK